MGSLSKIASAFKSGHITPSELVADTLARIDKYNPGLNAYLAVDADRAKQKAAEADLRWQKNQPKSPLDGVPFALKDNIDAIGFPTTGGIAALRDSMPEKDAEITRRLTNGGAILLGKANMHEGALGADNDNPHFGRCHNPYGKDITPGGSSGGSASAVAADLCAFAIGSDTLGSVRVPAAYCGIAGHKPTPGLISTDGVLPLSWTLDECGPMARAVEDLFPIMELVSGSNTLDWSVPNSSDLGAVTVGKLGHSALAACSDDIQAGYIQACEVLSRAGATIRDVDLGWYDFAQMRRTGLLISEIEGNAFYSDMLEQRPDGFSSVFKSLLAYGAKQSGGKIAKAYQAIRQLQLPVRELFSEIDLLILPTAPQTAFPFADGAPVDQADFTAFASLARLPATAVPVGMSGQGLPISVQLVSAPWQDRRTLQAAMVLQNEGHMKQPDLSWLSDED